MNDNLRRFLGPWTLSLTPANGEQLVGDFPAFIFDYAGLHDRESWASEHDVDLDAQWLPVGVFGDEIEMSPNDDASGALLLDTNSAVVIDEMAVHVVHFSDGQISPLASSLGALALQREPADPDECVRLKDNGNQLFGNGKLDQAIKQYIKAIWANPTNPAPYNNLAIARQAHSAGAGALELFRTSFLVDPTYTNGMRSYAKCLHDASKSGEAIAVLEKAIAIAPDEAHNHACLADIHTRVYAFEQAKAPCARALALDPADEMALAIQERLALKSPLACIESDLGRTRGLAEFRLLLANLNQYDLSEEDVDTLLKLATDRLNSMWLSLLHNAMLETMTLSTVTAVTILNQRDEGRSVIEHLAKWPELPSELLVKIMREELRSLIDEDENDELFAESTSILEAHATFQRPVGDAHAFVVLASELASHLKAPNQRFGNELLRWLDMGHLATEERDGESQHWYEDNFVTALDAYKKEILAIVEQREISEGGIDTISLSHSQDNYLLGVNTDSEDESNAHVEAFEDEGYEFWMAYSSIAEEEWSEFTEDSDVEGEFAYFLIFVLLGQVSLALRDDRDLKPYFSAKQQFSLDVDEVTHSPEFNASVPSYDLRKRILAEFTATPAVQELLLSLWSNDVGKVGQRFIEDLKGPKTPLWKRGVAFVRNALPQSKEVSEAALREVVAHAFRLNKDKKYAKAIGKLEPVLSEALSTSISVVYLETVCNLLGTLHKKDGALQAAESWFAKGASLFVANSALQLCSLHLEARNGPKLVAAAEPIQGATPYCDGFGYYKRYYLAMGHLLSRQLDEASRAFSELQSYLSDAPDRLSDIREGIEKFSDGDSELVEFSKKLIALFRAPEIPRQREDNNATWWASLTAEVQSMFDEIGDLSDPPQAGELDALLGSTSLNLRKKELCDISFLGAFSCLTELRLSRNAILDLRPLTALKTLRCLRVNGNPLRDLEPLSEMAQLEELDVSGCDISSLQPLKNLQYLTELKFDDNQVVDLSPLAGLLLLEEVEFDDNQVEDLSPLSTCTHLAKIDCDDNPTVRGFDQLAKLRWLRSLDFGSGAPADQLRVLAAAHPYFFSSESTFGVPSELKALYRPEISAEERTEFQAWSATQRKHSRRESWQQITEYLDEGVEPEKGTYWFHTAHHLSSGDETNLGDLEPLRPLRMVSWLGMGDSNIDDLSPISDWTHLRSLSVHENAITSLKPLASHRHLERIRVDACELQSLEGVENNRYLKKLDADENSICSLQPLANMAYLRSLSIQKNDIESLEPLRGLGRLQDLDVTQNACAIDLAPLQECESLVTLRCSTAASVSNLIALKNLPLLRKINIGRSVDAQQVRALQAARPDIRIT